MQVCLSALAAGFSSDARRKSKRRTMSLVPRPIPPNMFANRYFPAAEASVCPLDIEEWNSGITPTMISRKKILSRSRDNLNTDFSHDDEDIWFQKDRLFRDHIQEVLNKWKQLDDGIWGKVIVMERNRRVAKAYARVPQLTINGSDDGFDGYRIGLCGFDNPMRDDKTDLIKKHIGHGVKIRMDHVGNITITRVGKSNVYVKEVRTEDNSIGNDIVLAGGLLEMGKPVKLFDMKKFVSNIERELRKAYPERRKLESQCISAISFVKDCPELLDCCCWIMIINVVALDQLRFKLPPVSKRSGMEKIADRHQMPLPAEEDPYCVLNSCDGISQRGSNTLKDARPPKLPPRDGTRVPVPTPDYDEGNRERPMRRMQQQSAFKDDPYYCGLKARVPNFGRKAGSQNPMPQISPVRKSHSSGYLSLLRQSEKSFDSERENGNSSEEDSKFFGRMRTMNNQYPGVLYVGEWE